MPHFAVMPDASLESLRGNLIEGHNTSLEWALLDKALALAAERDSFRAQLSEANDKIARLEEQVNDLAHQDWSGWDN